MFQRQSGAGQATTEQQPIIRLADREHPRQQITRGEHDWMMLWTSERSFHTPCGPGNLTEALALFRAWASVAER
jgi:hypothetical protein